MRQNYENYSPVYYLDFYKLNGNFIYSKRLKIDGLRQNYNYAWSSDPEYDSSPIKISPNGRFLYYTTYENNTNYNYENNNQNNDSTNEDGSKKSNKKKKGERKYYPENYSKYTIHVFEIVAVRGRSAHDALVKKVHPILDSKKRSKSGNNEDYLPVPNLPFGQPERSKTRKFRYEESNKTINKIKNMKIRFELRKVRTFENSGKYFGEQYDPILTDLGTLSLYNQNEHRLFYEEHEFTEFVDKKIGKDDTLRRFTIDEYKWKVLKTGFLGYKDDLLYYLNLNVDMNKENDEFKVDVAYSKIIPMSCILGDGDLRVNSVYGCLDPTKVVFNLQSNVEESIYLVWSLETNTEVLNFSSKKSAYFAHGSGSSAGYIFSSDKYYVNLDNGIPNYQFSYEFMNGDIS